MTRWYRARLDEEGDQARSLKATARYKPALRPQLKTAEAGSRSACMGKGTQADLARFVRAVTCPLFSHEPGFLACSGLFLPRVVATAFIRHPF